MNVARNLLYSFIVRTIKEPIVNEVSELSLRAVSLCTFNSMKSTSRVQALGHQKKQFREAMHSRTVKGD